MLSAIPPKAGRTASGIPYGMVMSGTLFPSGSCSRPQASGFPSSHRSPRSPMPLRLQSRCSHPQHQPAGAAGLTRPKVVASFCYSWLCASGGKTIVPRSNLIPSAACRGLRPCLLAVLLLRELSADAATPERAKPPSPTTLTHAPPPCRKSPASHARPGFKDKKYNL